MNFHHFSSIIVVKNALGFIVLNTIGNFVRITGILIYSYNIRNNIGFSVNWLTMAVKTSPNQV